MKTLVQQAIQAALEKDWEKAIDLNSAFLAENPNDVPSLNRLSLAQTNLGKTKAARASLKRALDLDPSNPIALKNLQRLKAVQNTRLGPQKASSLTGSIFLKEEGKTKTVALTRPAEPQVLHTLSVGDNLVLDPKKRGIQVKKEKKYLGSLPNLLAFHLQKLLAKGYRYDVYLWRIEPKTISVFIKEVFQPKSMKGVPSFI